jgi:DNA primase
VRPTPDGECIAATVVLSESLEARRMLNTVYTQAPPRTTNETIPASFRRQIETVKDGVRIEDVAADYGEFQLQGSGRLLGRCVSPEHEDKTPSMTVYPDEQRFKCYGCGEHGDVIDLVRLVEGGATACDVVDAMMILAQRYGVELPARPQAWFARQSRQAKTRDALDEVKIKHIQRRLFRIFLPAIKAIEDDEERREELERVWDDCLAPAKLIFLGRRLS